MAYDRCSLRFCVGALLAPLSLPASGCGKSDQGMDSGGSATEGTTQSESESDSQTTGDPTAVCTFPDPNMEAAIREAIDVPAGPIKQGDLSGTILALGMFGIESLDGIECFERIEQLIVADNDVQSLEPLSQLAQLRMLNVRFNPVADVSPLGSLSLGSLTIADAPLADISPLNGMSTLSAINLTDDEIVDISAVASFTEAFGFNLRGNHIVDFSPVLVPPGVWSLSLDDNDIVSLAPLVTPNAEDLQSIGLAGNQITDLAPLAEASLPVLSSLDLSRNQLSDLSPLTGLGGLETLMINEVGISDLSPLASLGLADLRASGNGIGDLQFLAGWQGPTLDLSNNAISDPAPLLTAQWESPACSLVNLSGNPLDAAGASSVIDQLCAMSVIVTTDEMTCEAPECDPDPTDG